MLTFTINDGYVIEWRVNVSTVPRADNTHERVWTTDKKPEIWQPQRLPKSRAEQAAMNIAERYVVAVYADGDELEYVQNIFKGLPCMSSNHPRYGRGHTWRGDMARFIYDNL